MRYCIENCTQKNRLQSLKVEILDEYNIVDYKGVIGGGSGINPGVLVHRGLRLMLHFFPKVSWFAIIKYF